MGLAFLFIGVQLWQEGPWRLAAARGTPLLSAILVGAVAYGLGGLLLAAAWRELLGAAARTVPKRGHYAVYGRTQIAKYLPGNLFHFAGRQLLGRRLGHGHAALAFASLAEAASLSLAAGLLALSFVWDRLEIISGWTVVLAAMTGGSGLWLMCAAPGRGILAALWSTWLGRQMALIEVGWRQLLRACLLHAVFFVLCGALLWLLALAITGHALVLDPLTGMGAFAMAWLAGYVTPGSSAGIGVREAVLIMILTGSLGTETATLTALACRLITTGGDIVLFVIGAMLPLPNAPTDCQASTATPIEPAP